MPHVCPWWGGYFIDNRVRRLFHKPEVMLAPHVRPGMTVLDFGCGMGLCAIGMARLFGTEGQVIAVDLQQQMLDVLQKRAAKAGLSERIQTHRCEPDCIGIDGPIDFAVAFYSIHEVPEPRRLFAEVHALLRNSGKFLIAEPIGHVSAAAFDNLVSQGVAAGFKVIERPRICLSRAALLSKGAAAEAG
jgi:ubiquinone/menaquinone biosynthesis C-methylase UbiE